MTGGTSPPPSRRQKAAREVKAFIYLSLYLAGFFCSVVTYDMLLTDDFQTFYVGYSFALINALVIAKLILVGQWTHLGKRQESKPLFWAVIYKTFLFGMFVLAFHVLEEMVKGLIRGKSVTSALGEMRISLLSAHAVIVLFAFLSLFAFLELRRRLGEGAFRALVFEEGADRKVSS